ncbi:hypothetical protein M433DRAFT_237340 [Acidomyces richmondensis BFW]|nr:hypothetical protein M433DRAFT_237340 [Acidomyces richmondensis BFW]
MKGRRRSRGRLRPRRPTRHPRPPDPLVTPATPGANGYGSYHPATRHGSGMQQYPFTAQPQQQQTQQVAGQGQARPPSHGAHSHPSPAPYAPPSASPTPSSSHHSPLSVTHPPPSAPQPLYHSSQPGTPFGPPPPPTTSPIYPRTVTAASPSNNPRLGSGIPLESPRAVFREQSPPHLRRSSDYFDRERSVSVSPKTIPPPRRPDSLSSRHSSQDNMSAPTHTARPAAGAAAGAAAQSHVPPFPSPHAVAQTAAPHYYPPARDVVPSGQTTHPLSSLSAASGGPRGASSAASPDSLSELGPPHHPQSHVQQQQQALYSQPPRPPSSQSRPPLIQHHSSQKMGMNHLLADTSQTSVLAKPATHSSPPSQSHPPISTASTTEQGWTDDSRKRPADGMADGAPPLKRGRGRRYSERPAWARLAPTNPHFSQRTNGIKDSHKQQQQQQQHHHHHHHHHHQQQQQQQTNGSAVNDVSLPTQPQQANGHEAPTLDDLERAPWLHYPPPDLDLLRARRAFGRWEKSVDYKTQHPDVDAAVGDWLFRELAGLREVADLPHCAVEIEAKIGWLVAKDGEERMTGFPCENLVVLKEDWARANVRFQSQMDHVSVHVPLSLFLLSLSLSLSFIFMELQFHPQGLPFAISRVPYYPRSRQQVP